MDNRRSAILYRADFSDDTGGAELAAAETAFGVDLVRSRVDLQNRLVVSRYSCLPFYKELAADLAVQGSYLVNSLRQHLFLANFQWYDILKDITFETWFDTQSLPKTGVSFVVKGRTNSRKFEWDSMMHAPTYADALRISTKLGQDGLVGPQGLIYRRFTPLKVLEVGLNGLPFANEWRFFFWGEHMLARGFYWTATEKRGVLAPAGTMLARSAARRLAPHVNFFVVDIAETADGRWMVVEVNDGQMSGLSDISPAEFYSELAHVVAPAMQKDYPLACSKTDKNLEWRR